MKKSTKLEREALSWDPMPWLWTECGRAAREGWRSMCQTSGMVPHYVYFKPGTITIASTDLTADGYVLGRPDRVPSNKTIEQLTAWLVDRARSWPCLPDKDPALVQPATEHTGRRSRGTQ